MRPQVFSIQQRVMTLAACLLAFALLGLALISHSYAKRAADAAYDRLLKASALTIANAVQINEGQLTVELPYSAMAMLSDQERIFYSVQDGERHIAGYVDLGAKLPPAHSTQADFITQDYKEVEVRIATVGRLLSDAQQSTPRWVTVRVAETTGTREALTQELFSHSTLPLAGIIFVALLITAFGVRRAFAPLAAIAAELQQRSHDNLKPIEHAVPIEIKSLVQVLNEFMLRLKTSLHTLNHLLADAAHQIRTPLAALQMQSELALEENDSVQLKQRVRRIHANAAHMTQLLNQLLMDATISHRRDAANSSKLAVPALIKQVLSRVDPEVADVVQLNITPLAQRAHIMGDHIALREMLRNLIENAALYGNQSPVEIHVYSRENGFIVFDVLDRGPGINEAEKKQVLERFVRGSASQGKVGSGLGLAIVQAVVNNHGGTLQLRDRQGGGLTARVELPAQLSPRKLKLNPALSTALSLVLLLSTVFHSPTPTHAQALSPSLNMQANTYTYAAPNPSTPPSVLSISGPTDIAPFEKLILGFQHQYPMVEVIYHELDSQALYQHVRADTLPDTDVLVSSAADLQMRLANDGYALSHTSEQTRKSPEWARWRQEVFGFTIEPAVFVYANTAIPADELPRTHSALLHYLENHRKPLFQRVGSYDINVSGVGYLFAQYDERVSSNFWGLANEMGQVGVRLYGNSSAILKDLENGTLDLAYNVLGSYAMAAKQAGAEIEIVIPDDYVSVFSRTALIYSKAKNRHLAGLFIDYLLSEQGQLVAAKEAGLGALDSNTEGNWFGKHIKNQGLAIIQPATLKPTLLVGLDPTRRARFIKNWLRLVTDTPPLHSVDHNNP